MPYFSNLDEHSDLTDITFNDRKRFAPLDRFSQDLLRGDSPFSIPERELMAAYISGLNECTYCHGTHAAVAENFGFSASLIDSLLSDVEAADIDSKLKPVFAYLKKLTLTPSRMTQADADAVFVVGWSEQALYDAICICCTFNFFNRLLDGHGIKGNDNLHQIGATHLTKNGYGVPWFIGAIKKMIRKSKVKQLKEMEEKEAV